VEKVKTANRIRDEQELDFCIEVACGITPDAAGMVTDAGANVLVNGTAVFRAKD
jgi:ribulose-phosphate 3-epimerase